MYHFLRDCSEHDLTLGVFLLTKDDGSASLNNSEIFRLGFCAFQFQSDLLGLLSFLSEDWLCLPTETFLLHITSPLSLGSKGGLTCFVLRNFLDCMFLRLSAIS